jgi:hypothetical protein
MTRRTPAERPGAAQVADALRLIADGQTGERTMAMPPPVAATTVMPPSTATQAMSPEPVASAAGATARRRPTALIITMVVVLIAAVAVAVFYATQHDDGSDTQVKHGKPKLEQPLEKDVRRLEELVHR